MTTAKVSPNQVRARKRKLSESLGISLQLLQKASWWKFRKVSRGLQLEIVAQYLAEEAERESLRHGRKRTTD